MADNGFFTDKFFNSAVYKALQAPYNDRMARERAATNPLAPSQGGSWSSTPQRPVSTALTPQNYTPTVLPPDNSKRLAATMQPFPLAYPNDKPPIDITVRGGNQQVASVPMPQRRPWDAPNEAAIAAQDAGAMQPQVASAYAPEAPQNPAVAAAMAGLSPLSASERINQPMPGAPVAAPRVSPSQSYAAANAAAADRARTQDRSGTGTDGYVRDASGAVVGRDTKYQGMNPDQMYNAISGRPQDNSWKTIGSSASSGPSRAEELGFKTTAAMERAMRASGKYDGMGEEAAMEAFYKDKRRPSNGLVGSKGRI